MLSRTADHIFWMARYMERAENLARLLDVNSRMLLMPQTPQEIQQLWLATLDTIGLLESYGQQQGTVAPDQVAHFENGRSHLDMQRLRFLASRDRAAVIVGQDDDGHVAEPGIEQAFGRHIEIGDIEDRPHGRSTL